MKLGLIYFMAEIKAILTKAGLSPHPAHPILIRQQPWLNSLLPYSKRHVLQVIRRLGETSEAGLA